MLQMLDQKQVLSELSMGCLWYGGVCHVLCCGQYCLHHNRTWPWLLVDTAAHASAGWFDDWPSYLKQLVQVDEQQQQSWQPLVQLLSAISAVQVMWLMVVTKENVLWPASSYLTALPTLQQVQQCMCTLLSPENASSSRSGDGRHTAALLAVGVQLHTVERLLRMHSMCIKRPELKFALGRHVHAFMDSQLLAAAAQQQVTAVCQLLRRHHILPHLTAQSSSSSSSSGRDQHTSSEQREIGAGIAAAHESVVQQLPGGQAYIDTVAAVTNVDGAVSDGAVVSRHVSACGPAQCFWLRTGNAAAGLLDVMLAATHPLHWTTAFAEERQQRPVLAEACVLLSSSAAELALELQLLATARLQQLHQWREQLRKTQLQQQQQCDAEQQQQQPAPQEKQLQQEQCDAAISRLVDLMATSSSWLRMQIHAAYQGRGGSLQQALQQSGAGLLQALAVPLAADVAAHITQLCHQKCIWQGSSCSL
jgi:hypothetical protein